MITEYVSGGSKTTPTQFGRPNLRNILLCKTKGLILNFKILNSETLKKWALSERRVVMEMEED